MSDEPMLVTAKGGGFPCAVGDTVYWCSVCEDVAGARCETHQEHFVVARVVDLDG